MIQMTLAADILIALWVISSLCVTTIGLIGLFGIRLKEKTAASFAMFSATFGLGASLVLTGLLSAVPESARLIQVDLANQMSHWLSSSIFQVARLQIEVSLETALFLVISHGILGASTRFASNYLHRDPGYQRFMTLFVVMQMGLLMVTTAGELKVVFLGWETVGLTSILLIGFFHTNRTVGERSLVALSSYKVADIGLIVACVLLHHLGEHSSLSHLNEIRDQLLATGRSGMLTLVGAVVIFGTLAKGGQFPFVTWMPRAMEGPTPSSATFYGALSVHLAPLLLFRATDIWFWSPILRTFVGGIGVLTALLTTAIGRTQSNVKGQLAYSVMAQVGVIYAELALGFWNLALLHMAGHASLRTIQYLRSGSMLSDFARNRALAHPKTLQSLRSDFEKRWYIHTWNGFYIDVMIARILIQPLNTLARICHKTIFSLIRSNKERYEVKP